LEQNVIRPKIICILVGQSVFVLKVLDRSKCPMNLKPLGDQGAILKVVNFNIQAED